MQSADAINSLNGFVVKSEVITIDEDDNQPIKSEVIQLKPAKKVGTIFYFEQQKPNLINNANEQKTDNEKPTKSIQILCIDCPLTSGSSRLFDNRVALELHYKKSHKEQPITFACVACDYNAKKYTLLRNHFKRHLNGRHQCNECSNTYSQKSDLIYHKTTIHGLKICRKCSMEFISMESFLEHKKTHVVAPAKPKAKTEKECPDCGKILLTSGGLFTHRKMHLEKPKFQCEICLKEFFQKVNLVNHTKTHNVQNRSFNCDQCDKSFFEKSHLQRHQNFHSVSRDYECTECHRFYKTERCLKVHKAVHSNYRKYVCQFSGCQKGFLSSSKLKQHSNVHLNLRPYKCKQCPRDFTNYPNLLKHTIRRHKVDHRTGKPLDKIPDYVTNKKKKKVVPTTVADNINLPMLIKPDSSPIEQNKDQIGHDDTNVIQIPDDDFDVLPSTSGLIRGFQFNDDTNYEIMLDIDQEFSDFQLLSPGKDYDSQEYINYDNDPEQFSIIDATDLQFFNGENSLNQNLLHLVSSGQ